jgi:hypothetical protein
VSNDEVIRGVDQYCARLREAMRNAPAAERDELVAEVRAHIVERLEGPPEVTPSRLSEVLRAVGDPDALAAEYQTDALLRRAARSTSPWILMRAALRSTMVSGAGLLVILALTLGYGSATVFVSSALLKPFFPSRVGLWLGPEQTLTFGFWNGRVSGVEVYGVAVRPPASFVLGTLSATDGAVHELLGFWLIPVGLVGGVALFFATTLLARWWVARVRSSRRPARQRAIDRAGATP